MNALAWRLVFLALVATSVSCSGNGKDEGAQSEAPVASQASPDTSAVSAKVDARNLGDLVDLIVARSNDIPKAEFDPAALAQSAGKDPQRLYEWVRDRTWWAPYRGLLRGANGVMLDRVGSSLDRAVLLGELLRHGGHTVRLAHAEISDTQARELLGKLRPIPDERRNPVAPRSASPDREGSIEALIPGFRKSLQTQLADSRRLPDDAKALIRSQSEQLYAVVRDVAPQANNAEDRAAIAALRDHWWVEREQDGKWIAMDVLLPDASVGETIVAASTTSDWKPAAAAPSIPDSDWHTVQIRVVVERYESGKTTESIALETVLRPAEVFLRPIMLSHLPQPWPQEDLKSDSNARRNAALWVNRWVPILQVGDDYIVQSAFTDSGELTRSSSDSAGGLGASTGGGLDFAGSSLSGGEETESFATAEWIDYEIRVPGESNQRLRRPVFDLLGPSKRSNRTTDFEAHDDSLKLERFDALSSRTDVLLQPCDFTGEFVTHLMLRGVNENRAAIKELAQERDQQKVKALASEILGRMDIWGPLPKLALWRSALRTQPGEWFIDQPNVLNYRVGTPVANTERKPARELIDIASNSTGVRLGTTRNAFEMRLSQGVADTVAEILTLGGELRKTENTASVFAIANPGIDGVMRIRPRDAASVQKLGWPAEVAARLTASIEQGYMAVALEQPVTLGGRQRLGWWQVDPASGKTIGVMDTGFHAAAPEDILDRAQTQRYNLLKKKMDMHDTVGGDYSLLTPEEVVDMWLIDKMIGVLLLLTEL